MKNEQRREAQDLYLQSGLTKTQIAEKLNVSRRTIYQWSLEDNWDKLRTSARNMPSMLAEKCYYLMGHFTDHLLHKDAYYQSVTKTDADILHRMAITVNKLKQGSTVNENLETFTHFLERVSHKDPALAGQIAPHVSEYIAARNGRSESDYFLQGFDQHGQLPFPEEEIMEKWQDDEDLKSLREEMKQQQQQQPVEPQDFAAPRNTGKTTPQPPDFTAPVENNTHNVEPQDFAAPGNTDKTTPPQPQDFAAPVENNTANAETQNIASPQNTDTTATQTTTGTTAKPQQEHQTPNKPILNHYKQKDNPTPWQRSGVRTRDLPKNSRAA